VTEQRSGASVLGRERPALRFSSGSDAISRLRPLWEERAATMAGFGPFFGPDWAELWWAHFGEPAESDLLIGELGDGEAVLPMYRTADGVVSFLGGSDVTDYVGPVGPLAGHAAAGEALVDHLAADSDWLVFRAVAVPAESGFSAAAALAAVRHGYDVRISTEDSALLTLPGTFDDYLQLVGKKERHEIRRKDRRLARDLGDLHVEQDAELPAAMEGFVEMHRKARGDKGGFMSEAMAAFFHDLGRRFAALGSLRLDSLSAGGQPVAATLGFADEAGYYLYNSAYETGFTSLSPGVVLLARLIEREIGLGRPVFDFLRGDERYKFRLGAVPRPLRRLEISRRPLT